MKVLISGIDGFVGFHLSNALKKCSEKYSLYGTTIVKDFSLPDIHVEAMDLLDRSRVFDVIDMIRPDFVYHLAGQANVGLSWTQPALTNSINVQGTLNLLDAIRDQKIPARILIIGSSDQYGILPPEASPVNEGTVQSPSSPYAISKFAQELYAGLYSSKYGMDIILTHSFNHIGAGQNLGFVATDFADKIVKLEKNGGGSLLVGNLDAVRDFSDVRDIVDAYQLLMKKGRTNEVYNIGSGKPLSIRSLLEIMLSYAKVNIQIVQDPSRMRPSDIPLIYCDNAKITGLGYQPKYRIEDTLRWVLDDWRNR